VVRLQGSGPYDLKPDRCVASDQIDSYLEPDGRSGITSPSDVNFCASSALGTKDSELRCPLFLFLLASVAYTQSNLLLPFYPTCSIECEDL
jgi:hypothetical protein